MIREKNQENKTQEKKNEKQRKDRDLLGKGLNVQENRRKRKWKKRKNFTREMKPTPSPNLEENYQN